MSILQPLENKTTLMSLSKLPRTGSLRVRASCGITHRICGSSDEINYELTRAVCKMKITITCRFTFDDIEMDKESDCRFFFLLEKRQGRWGVCFYILLSDKDKSIPVNPAETFHIPKREVDDFPSRYRYLA
ncbi:hypothetical protein BDV29DRAFT_171311 [Aspergillus leporis]|uniref:Uncharacterized protein n=1 Tax=Aspergillus leporis TaxID=41062 RepID=A0A5N5X4W9_9EURO|nr:hypothetical protein BDV29DRAFT_171311 [Aspergillus leporis]